LFFFFFTDIKKVEVEFLRVIRNHQYCHCDDTVFVGIAYFFVTKLQFPPNLSNLEKRILVWNAFGMMLKIDQGALLDADAKIMDSLIITVLLVIANVMVTIILVGRSCHVCLSS
jgi:hypothetical protein